MIQIFLIGNQPDEDKRALALFSVCAGDRILSMLTGGNLKPVSHPL
jgi:hypothetical protein